MIRGEERRRKGDVNKQRDGKSEKLDAAKSEKKKGVSEHAVGER